MRVLDADAGMAFDAGGGGVDDVDFDVDEDVDEDVDVDVDDDWGGSWRLLRTMHMERSCWSRHCVQQGASQYSHAIATASEFPLWGISSSWGQGEERRSRLWEGGGEEDGWALREEATSDVFPPVWAMERINSSSVEGPKTASGRYLCDPSRASTRTHPGDGGEGVGDSSAPTTRNTAPRATWPHCVYGWNESRLNEVSVFTNEGPSVRDINTPDSRLPTERDVVDWQ